MFAMKSRDPICKPRMMRSSSVKSFVVASQAKRTFADPIPGTETVATGDPLPRANFKLGGATGVSRE